MTKLTEIIEGSLGHASPAMMDGSPDGGRLLATFIASVLTEATGGADHLVRVRGSAWTLQHPLPERFEDRGNGTSLMDCRFTPLVNAAMEQGAMFDGTHRVWIDRGVLQWEEIA